MSWILSYNYIFENLQNHEETIWRKVAFEPHQENNASQQRNRQNITADTAADSMGTRSLYRGYQFQVVQIV